MPAASDGSEARLRTRRLCPPSENQSLSDPHRAQEPRGPAPPGSQSGPGMPHTLAGPASHCPAPFRGPIPPRG